MLRVAIIDDAADLRMVLRMQIEASPDFAVCAEAGDGAAAVELARDLRPDVMLLDVSMPVMDGMTALPLILAASPRTQVVILSGTIGEELAERAHAQGATGCLDKVLGKGLMPDRLRAVLAPAQFRDATTPPVADG